MGRRTTVRENLFGYLDVHGILVEKLGEGNRSNNKNSIDDDHNTKKMYQWRLEKKETPAVGQARSSNSKRGAEMGVNVCTSKALDLSSILAALLTAMRSNVMLFR